MKRVAALVGGALLASTSLFFGGAASGQETTTTIEEPTTTSEAPTTTVEGPTTTVEGPTTTVEGPTTTVPIVLPGEHIDAGSIEIGANLQTNPDLNCRLSGSLAGGEMNVIKNEVGVIGAVYGKANVTGGTTGVVMVQLGPLPTAVLAYRNTGSCNQDVVALGGFGSTPTSARFEGIGYAIYPESDFANYVYGDVQVQSVSPTASLDIQAAYDFLAEKRPGTEPPPGG